MTTQVLSAEFEGRLARFAELEPHWDGYNGLPIPQIVIERARYFVNLLAPIVGEPWVGPCATGEILLQCQLPGGKTVDFYVDEQINDWEVAFCDPSREPAVSGHDVTDEAGLVQFLTQAVA